MTTIRRRELKRRPLSRSARELLRYIDAQDPPGYPREIVAACGIRSDWAWSAMTQLLERDMIERRPWGHIRVTGNGRALLRDAA